MFTHIYESIIHEIIGKMLGKKQHFLGTVQGSQLLWSPFFL